MLNHNISSNDKIILDQNHITIWQYPLNEIFDNSWNVLSHNEQERASRFYFPRHKRRFIVAHAMLRLIIGEYLNVSGNKLKFATHAKGKPYLIDFPELQFNLSHSKDLALLAIGRKHPLGIDLEFFSNRPYEGIGTQMFSKTENNFLKMVHSSIKPLAFFNIWAQKEAVIKAFGIGLNDKTHEFDIPVGTLSNQAKIISAYQNNWKIISFMPEIACSGALCYNPDVRNLNYIKLVSARPEAIKNQLK